MPKIQYGYLRALQLEGRHPHDVGAWGTTSCRMLVGEGVLLSNDHRSHLEFDDAGILPDVPILDGGFTGHISYFRRLTTINDVEAYLDEHKPRLNESKGGVHISIPLYQEWIEAPSGRIPSVQYDKQESKISHAVIIKAYNPSGEGEFKFWNNWRNWGADHFGYLPYDYFNRYAFECYGGHVVEHYLHRASQKFRGFGTLVSWTAKAISLGRTYGFEFFGDSRDDQRRIGWCFIGDKGKSLDIEEFYVRPEYRGKGYGRLLADRVNDFIHQAGKPVNLWVPFADCHSEAPQTFDAMVAIVKRLGLVFFKSQSSFSAYLAQSRRLGVFGSQVPIEPDFIPIRPTSSFSQLLTAFAIALPAPAVVEAPQVSASATEQTFPEVGTEAWDKMNHRRYFLIRREVLDGLDSLTDDERKEYEWLQKMSLQTVQKKQLPTNLSRDLMELREALELEAKSG